MMKNFFNKIYTFYCKISNLVFYILLCCLVAVSIFLTLEIQEKKLEKARIEALKAKAPEVVVEEKTLSDSPIYNKLLQMGVGVKETDAIVKKLDTIMYTRKLRGQDKYLISLDKAGNFKIIVVSRDLTHYYVAKIKEEYVAGIIDQDIKSERKNASGTIQSSLFASMQSSGMEIPLILALTDVFSWNIDFNTETRNGDEYAVVWEEDSTSKGGVVGQTILAAKYKGAQTGTNYAFAFNGDFYDESGKMSKRLFLKSPIAFANFRITSRFTKSRMHPILRISRPHLGIDYAAPVGTPIQSIADGTVKFSGWKGGFGNYVEIAHANGYITTYGHLKSISAKNGARIRQGGTVGYLGSSGLSTGPHLDFRIKENGKFIDFLRIKNRNSAISEIPKEQMEEFYKVRDGYKKILDGETK